MRWLTKAGVIYKGKAGERLRTLPSCNFVAASLYPNNSYSITMSNVEWDSKTVIGNRAHRATTTKKASDLNGKLLPYACTTRVLLTPPGHTSGMYTVAEVYSRKMDSCLMSRLAAPALSLERTKR